MKTKCQHIIILCLSVPAILLAAKGPGPLERGITALSRDDYVAADKWLDTTVTDFDGETKISAQALKTMLALARELGHVKVARYLSEGSELELKKKQRWEKRITDLENKASVAGKRALPNLLPLIAFEHLPEVKIHLQLSLESLLSNRDIARIEKGEWLTDKEITALVGHETKRHLIGILQDVLASSDSSLASGRLTGAIKWEMFFRTAGVRFYLLGRRLKDEKLILQARECFSKVLLLTVTEPYHPDRKRAQDFIVAIDKLIEEPSQKK